MDEKDFSQLPMATIGSVGSVASASPGRAMRSPGAASGELAKLKSQLSGWVNCASSKTSAGRAKIADISGKIDAITAQSEQAEINRDSASKSASRDESLGKSAQQIRNHNVGNLLNVVA